MKNGKFLVVLSVAIILMIGNCFAFGRVVNEKAILDDMYANLGKYIQYGGYSTGYSILIDRTSIKSDKYAPPEYIISAREITHHCVPGENIVGDIIIRYRYNYNSRQMWRETLDENQNLVWKNIDPTQSKSYHDDNLVAAGEILFYLAYNMSFFDTPVTERAKDYINEGRSGLPLINLDNGGDSTVWHVYNHKTKQIEWWKISTNPKTKNSEWKRVK